MELNSLRNCAYRVPCGLNVLLVVLVDDGIVFSGVLNARSIQSNRPSLVANSSRAVLGELRVTNNKFATVVLHAASEFTNTLVRPSQSNNIGGADKIS